MLTEQIYREIVETLPEAILVVADSGAILLCNQRAKVLYGVMEGEPALEGIQALSLVALEERPKIRSALSACMESIPQVVTCTMQGRDSRQFQAELQLTLMRDAEGSLTVWSIRPQSPPTETGFAPMNVANSAPSGLVPVSAKEDSQSLREYCRRLEAMHQVDRALLAGQSPEAVAEAALQCAESLTFFSQGTVFEFDFRTAQARVLASTMDGIKPLSGVIVVGLAEFWVERLAQGQVQWVGGADEEGEITSFSSALCMGRLRSCVHVPMLLDGRLSGCLTLGLREGEAMDGDRLTVLREMANSLAIALRNARLREQSAQDAETKALLLNEVNHRVKNNLSAMIGLLLASRKHVRYARDTAAVRVIDDLIGRVQGLATTHRMLSASEWAPVPVGDLVRQVIEGCLHALAPSKRIHLSIQPCGVRVDARVAGSLALVVSELTTNSIKHAVGERESARIQANISLAHGIVLVEYRDDGPGFPPDALRGEHSTLGMSLIQGIVQNDLQGAVSCHNEGGAVTRIRFKATERKETLDAGFQRTASLGS